MVPSRRVPMFRFFGEQSGGSSGILPTRSVMRSLERPSRSIGSWGRGSWKQIAKGYVIDLLIEESLIVEIKSVDNLLPLHAAQLMTYLRLQQLSAGLLINFNVHTLLHGLRRILR